MTASQIVDLIIQWVFSLWALPVVALLGFVMGGKSPARSGITLLSLGAAPIVLMLLLLTASGCWAQKGCMGFFGMMLAFGAGVYWIVAGALGMGLRYLAGRISAAHGARDRAG
jgi:hypothetical protein